MHIRRPTTPRPLKQRLLQPGDLRVYTRGSRRSLSLSLSLSLPPSLSLSLSLYIYICMYMCIRLVSLKRTYMYTYIHTHRYLCIHTNQYTYIHKYIHTPMYVDPSSSLPQAHCLGVRCLPRLARRGCRKALRSDLPSFVCPYECLFQLRCLPGAAYR